MTVSLIPTPEPLSTSLISIPSPENIFAPCAPPVMDRRYRVRLALVAVEEVSDPTPASYQTVCSSSLRRSLESLQMLVAIDSPSGRLSGRLDVPSHRITMRRPGPACMGISTFCSGG